MLDRLSRRIRSWIGQDTHLDTSSSFTEGDIYPDDTFIVSFPRSGNSFLQHLICNYLHPEGFENTYSVIPDLHMNPGRTREIDRPRLIKSHAAEVQPYPRVIYVARDGRDVAISYHAFLIRAGVLDDDVSFASFLPRFCTGEFEYGRWGDHVNTWLDVSMSTHVVRYADMLDDGATELRRVLEFLDRDPDSDRIEHAVEASQFDRLHQREKKNLDGDGVPDEKKFFFRKGLKKQWESTFTNEMNELFLETNGEALHRLGFLPY